MYIKDRGGSCGCNAVPDRQWQVEAWTRQTHLHMNGALCHSKHYICICNAAQTQDWEFIHSHIRVCVCG